MADRPGLVENVPATSAEADVPAPRTEDNGSQEGQAEEDSEGEGTEEEGTDGQLESDSDCDGSVF